MNKNKLFASFVLLSGMFSALGMASIAPVSYPDESQSVSRQEGPATITREKDRSTTESILHALTFGLLFKSKTETITLDSASTGGFAAQGPRGESVFTEEHYGYSPGWNNEQEDNRWRACEENPTPVPEPSSLLLLGSGFVGLLGYARKKMKA